MAAVIDLEELPITDSVDFLRERMLTAPVPLELAPRRGSQIVVRSRVADLGTVHLLCTKAKGGDVVRSSRLAAAAHAPSLMISVMGTGVTTVRRGDHALLLRPGDVTLYASDEPYRIGFTDGAERSTFQIPFDRLQLPRDLIQRQLRDAIRPDTTATLLVSSFLQTTARSAPHTQTTKLTSQEAPLLDLVRLLLTRRVADTALGRKALADSLGTRIEQHIRRHIADPDLRARSVAEAFSISERYVYLLLARRGIELGDMLRAARLERARRLIDDPTCTMTLAAIAHQCGFADHAHLTRAFRRRYGLTPSEWRHTSTPKLVNAD